MFYLANRRTLAFAKKSVFKNPFTGPNYSVSPTLRNRIDLHVFCRHFCDKKPRSTQIVPSGPFENLQGPQAHELDLEGVEKWCRKGILARDSENFEEALSCFTKAIQASNRSSPRAFSLRGDLLQTHGKFELAIEDYNAVVAFVPTHVPTFSAIFACYKGMGQYQRALDGFSQILSKNSNFSPAMIGLAECHALLGRCDLAADVYRQVLALNHKTTPTFSVHVALAECLILSGRYREASEVYEKALLLRPEDGNCWASYGTVLYIMQDFPACINALTKAILFHADRLGDAFIKRAAAYLRIGNIENAMIDCEQALTSSSNIPEATLIRAQCFNAMEDYQKAVDDYTHYLEHADISQSSNCVTAEAASAHQSQISAVYAQRALCRIALYLTGLNSNQTADITSASINEEKKISQKELLDLYLYVQQILSTGNYHPLLKLAFDDLVQARKQSKLEPSLSTSLSLIKSILNSCYSTK